MPINTIKTIMNNFYKLILTALLMPSLAAMAQDNCASALLIEPGYYIVDAVNGTELPAVTCSGAQGGAETAEWYTYTPDADYNMTVSSYINGITPVDTRMHIYTGTCGNLTCAGGDDDTGPGYSSIATMNVEAGVTYTIVWDNYWTNAGFTFSLTVTDPIVTLVGFTPTTVSVGAQAVMDMNGDYLDDLVAAGSQSLSIAYQMPDGSFNTQSLPISGEVANSPSWSMCGGDLDGNGFNDLIFAGGSGASFIWANDNGTAYNEISDGNYIFCQRSNLVDIDADGNLDAFVCHDVAPNVWYMNNGTQNFEWNQGGLGDTPDGGNYGSVWIDYDNDCDIDMFIAKCRGGNSAANINQMHRNNGDGTFTEVGPEIGLADNVQTWSSAWADYDNDGDMDVVVGASSFTNGGHKVMINDGYGNFTNQTTGTGFDTFASTGIEWAPADFNNDGFVDVIGAGNTIMVNNGNMTFSPSPVNFGVGPMGDINNDGFIDVVAGGTAHLNTPNGNNHITINMQGTSSNKNGIGARVTLYTANGQQIRDVRSGEGFRYMSTLNVHFGLGEEEEIDRITVCWPSGITDEILNPAINQTLTIVEGTQILSVAESTETIDFTIFPNPAFDFISVNGTSSSAVTILDISGKLIQSVTMVQQRIDVSDLAPGVYFVQANTAEGIQQKKFIKQ
jgi:hypothetical protein